ncbi:hypothetical protein N7509_001910 [Penicillium cosmopolitanum]|uniref:Carboxylic ester hydrolase n=1 Tax=Penicillium cosmopolitanum TaxID=1131564 RepID=A0A9X0BCT6_9EURO|nr:uncharacterized protein N7509_001910 [Penicillium cosmopolitanum]KAJ5408027.1 hypothetical protein N7509_001910 [Penicillium cosmopolitanum]
MKVFLCAAIALSWTHHALAKSCSDLLRYQALNRTAIENAEPTHLSSSADGIAYCRVSGSVAYGERGNSVRFELWLPEQKSYNNRFMVVGNGGFAGIIDTASMEKQLEQGFAVAGGDSGHLEVNNGNGTTTSGQYIPFLNDAEQTKAWIHDSIAIITEPTRDITSEFYGSSPKHSYYNGCSTGGAQGFALAQYHPHLFDGIYAGSPGNWYSHLMLSFLWNRERTKGDAYLDQATLNATTKKILDACDEIDGVKDGLIENPLLCHFDLDTLARSSATTVASHNQTCLSPKQIQSLKSIYAGPRNPRTGAIIYPGFEFGSERELMLQETSLYLAYAAPLLQNLVFHNLSYEVDTFDFDKDVAKVNSLASPLIDEISSDLDAFRLRGGKMIVTQGWTDPFNAPTWPIEHLKQLEKASQHGSVAEFFNLYMVPGGGHCGAAETYPSVPATYHVNEALLAWVEKDIFPSWIQSSNPPDGSSRTRKLCPWPKTAKLRDLTRPDISESYECDQD